MKLFSIILWGYENHTSNFYGVQTISFGKFLVMSSIKC